MLELTDRKSIWKTKNPTLADVAAELRLAENGGDVADIRLRLLELSGLRVCDDCEDYYDNEEPCTSCKNTGVVAVGESR